MSLVDMRIDVDEYFPTSRSPCPPRRSSSLPLMLIDCYSRHRSDSSRSTVLYDKLPEEPFRLSVLKLDGSCFEIQVTKSATVAEVRQAVEEVFSLMPGTAEISWSHVWGQFCLCYDGQKLLLETEYIRNYNIRDGDQLQFIRHSSVDDSPSKKQSMRWIPQSEQPKISWLSSKSKKEDQSDHEGRHSCDDEENGIIRHPYEEDDGVAAHDGPMWSYIVRSWSSHASNLPASSEEMKVFTASSGSSDSGFVGRFRKFMQYCNNSR